MNKRRKKRQRRKRGRGILLGSDWSKIYRNFQPYLRKKKQKGGSIWTWAIKKIANPNPVSRFLNNPDKGAAWLNKFV